MGKNIYQHMLLYTVTYGAFMLNLLCLATIKQVYLTLGEIRQMTYNSMHKYIYDPNIFIL